MLRPIVTWDKNNYSQMANPIKKAFEQCNIEINKVCHLRKHNIEYNGFKVS